mmetsp:Transcript_28464/g.77087  ORF Transcript_28464/g.77087 Transcript_28464/m.77087 type:complete len:571 (-) Transcript_28464:779-2491(-)|eukprot:CAMPEP_0172367602 /NCGR_PEP_ID=MMETSP1060-20121228/22592_1 /TAXON_ID=37318 /ORGANISM="Pseudo-nitzschia pungens, Strain cf. cingulata" /LENGTH=570 /DNA_ID=CAMNT_0013091915 /DNA_START=6 /DNA_END=1718 /DNA_ORIENTATION=+
MDEDKVVKAAKKILKKQDSGSMKLKDLAKLVAEKLGDKENFKNAKKLITKNNKFCVDGKEVSLSKKTKRDNSDSDAVVPSKKARVSEKTESDSSPDKSLDSIESWRKDNKIVLKHAKDDDEGREETKKINTDDAYSPFTTFAACKSIIEDSLIRQCTDANGFEKPSPIQAQSWPILMHKKRDLVGIAETGSGKTLAFSIPALSSMAKNPVASKRRLPRMLVLSPTRELAMQVEVVLREYGAVVGMRSLCLYGGVPKYTQTSELRKGNIDCLVATPGRLKDLINEGSCNLSKVQHLVLDEADRMLDMGFEEDVKYIISNCMPKEDGRQTAMFSATWPAIIQEIAMNYMTNPVRLYVGFEGIVGSNGENNIDDSLSANKRVTQTIEVIEDRPRENRLREILRKHKSKGRILVFALYKKEAERLEYNLKRDGFDVCSIHGNKHQAARTQALSDFKDGTCQMMVATDVAARGLDIPDVELVLNYTFPLTIEDYVHRIGRTGRAGKSGLSITFFQPSDKSHAGELQQVMKQAGQEPPEALMKFGSTIKKKEHKLYGNFGPRGGGPMKKATRIVFD